MRNQLYDDWLLAKAEEKKAIEKRRETEDILIEEWGVCIDSEEGSKTFDDNGYKIKVTFRQTKKVDFEQLKLLAIESGVESHLDALLRYKVEINKKAWDNASTDITGKLLEAITTTPGRPSFSIESLEIF